jgi:hypothetical protein
MKLYKKALHLIYIRKRNKYFSFLFSISPFTHTIYTHINCVSKEDYGKEFISAVM